MWNQTSQVSSPGFSCGAKSCVTGWPRRSLELQRSGGLPAWPGSVSWGAWGRHPLLSQALPVTRFGGRLWAKWQRERAHSPPWAAPGSHLHEQNKQDSRWFLGRSSHDHPASGLVTMDSFPGHPEVSSVTRPPWARAWCPPVSRLRTQHVLLRGRLQAQGMAPDQTPSGDSGRLSACPRSLLGVDGGSAVSRCQRRMAFRDLASHDTDLHVFSAAGEPEKAGLGLGSKMLWK